MTTKVRLPSLKKLTGKILWLKNVGDAVAEDDVLLEIDFGGIRVPLHAPCAGRLESRAVDEGHDAHSDAVVALVDGARELVDPDWVSLTCTFKCRMCGFFVPLHSIDTDGVVACARCSLEQAFDVKAWEEAFTFARDVGRTRKQGAKKRTIDTDTHLALEVKAAQPTCTTCNGAVNVAFGHGTATTSCARCNVAIGYVVPNAARNLSHGTLVATIASEHRSDHATVRIEESQTALAIQCPSCSAPLDAGSSSKIVTCKFCNVTSRIPDRVWFRLNGKDTAPEPIFLAFVGASPTAERERNEAFARALDGVLRAAEEEHEAKRRREAAAREKAADDRVVAQVRAEEAAKAEVDAKQKKQATLVVSILFLVSLLIGGLVVGWLVLGSDDHGRPPPAATTHRR